MRLRKECEHGRWEEHWWRHFDTDKPTFCPGGEFLPEGALVMSEASDLELLTELDRRSKKPTKGGIVVTRALASQVGESE